MDAFDLELIFCHKYHPDQGLRLHLHGQVAERWEGDLEPKRPFSFQPSSAFDVQPAEAYFGLKN